MAHSTHAELPKFVVERLADLARQVRLRTGKIWLRQLTQEQRQRAEQGDSMGPEIIDIWAQVHDLSPYQAVIQLAEKNNFLMSGEAQDLLGHLGLLTPPRRRPKARSKPVFGEDGVLWWDGRAILELRLMNVKSGPELVLRAFQQARWKKEIDSPFAGNGGEFLYNVLRQLNQKSDEIQFHACRGATRVRWNRPTDSELPA